MNELTFPTLEAVLRDFVRDVGAEYAAVIARNDHNASHNLSNTATSADAQKVTVVTGGYEVSLDLPKYWKYIEHGLAPGGKYGNPGWKAYPAIRRWIDIKPVIPRPGRNGRIPTPNQLAYLITRKIVNEGTTGTHDLATARDATLPEYMDRIADALQKDAEGYILKVMEPGTTVIETEL